MVRKKLNFNRDYTEDVLGIGKDLLGDDPIRDLVNRYSPIPTIEAPKGLVPIGDSGLYRTPDESADPTDCDRYPSSIYCGENPFTLTPVSIEPSIIIDECNIGIQLEPTFGFIKLPPVSIVYRRPGCREAEPKERKQELPDKDNYNEPLTYKRLNCSEGSGGTMIDYEEEYKESYFLDFSNIFAIYKTLHRAISYTKVTNEILEVNHPYKVRYLFDEDNDLIYLHLKIKITVEQSTNTPVAGFTKNLEADQRALMRPGISTRFTRIEDKWLHKYNEGGFPGRVSTSQTYIGVRNYGNIVASIEGAEEQINRCTNIQTRGYAPAKDDFDNNLVVEGNAYFNTYFFKQTNRVLQYCDHPVLIIPPPPPLIKPPKKMECCPEHTLLLLSLIKKVDKLSKIIGVDEYPASMPASLISKDEGFLGNLIPNANREIPNLTQFLAWYVERFDEVLGQWEIPIEIKDSDPSKPGDQPLGVKLPNMAEAIGEMFTLAFQTNLNTETLLNFAVRNAGESITDKQQNFITFKLLQSLTDYMGYKQKDVSLDMPSSFTLGETRYDKILQESNIKVPVQELDEKFNLEADLMKFREAAAILAANYKRKINPGLDIKAQILNQLLDAYRSSNKVNGEEDENFDEFLRQVEEGYNGVAGVTDPTKPYGRDYTQRPKIRDLTNYEKPAED